MNIKALLKLPKTEESFKEIEAFLAETHDLNEILLVESFYADILIEYGNSDTAIQLLTHIMTSLKNRQDDPLYEKALRQTVDAYIEKKDYDNAIEAINQRRKTLPILKHYLYYLDLIKLHKALNMPYFELIDQALEEVLPDEIKSNFLIEKVDKYIGNHEFDLALLSINSLKNTKLDPQTRFRLEKIELDIYVEKADVVMLEKLLEGKTDASFDYYYLKLYVLSDKYRQASLYEVEHEHRFEQLDYETQKKIYELLIDVYKRQNDKLSLENYSKKLKSLKKQEPKIDTPVKPKQIKKEELESEPFKIEIKEKIIEVNKVKQSEAFDYIRSLLNKDIEIYQIKGLREKIRQLLMIAEKKYPFKEAVIYVDPNKLYHYKMGRLYEKPLLKEHFFKSVLHVAFDRQEDIIESRTLVRWPIDVLTGKPYEDHINQLYTYHDSTGSIVFYQTETKNVFIEDDFFNMLSVLVFNVIKKDLVLHSLELEKDLFKAIYQSDLTAYRVVEDDLMRFNKQALKLFDFPKYAPISAFNQQLRGEDQIRYKNFLSTLTGKSTINYQYQDKDIEETSTLIIVDNKRIILSKFKDITSQKNYEDNLLKTALIDQKNNVANRFAFEEKLSFFTNQKTTFILTELNGLENIQALYGLSKVDSFFKHFIEAHLNHFKQDVYLFDNNKLLIVLPINDVRAVEKAMRDYGEALIAHSDGIIEHFSFNSGVIRYPINTTETKSEKLYSFLGLALERAKRRGQKSFYHYFDFEDYKEEQFELSIIEQMNMGIMNESLEIQFSPIIHLQSNKVFGYSVYPCVPNLMVDSNYYSLIAKKRSIIERFDRYILKTSAKFLQKLEKETGKYIRLSIDIDEETVRSKEFNPFFIGLLKQHDLPYTLYELRIKSDRLSDLDFLRLKELSDLGIHIGVESFNYMIKDIHFVHLTDRFKLDDIKVFDYLFAQKEYAEHHGIGLVFDRLEDKDLHKLKQYSPIYQLDSRKKMDELSMINKIKGVVV